MTAQTIERPTYGAGLLPQHANLLRASAIDPGVAAERGYVSVDTRSRLSRLGFEDYQCLVPGLLIPIHRVTGEIANHEYRPDAPRTNANGKAVKYDRPTGISNVLDVHPRVREQLGDPNVHLWITEGARKADSAVSAGLCCIGLNGVNGWRGKNVGGGRTALGDWESIDLTNRRVFICFDSDVTTKPAVAAALTRLHAFLESRGARVQIIYLPGGTEAKVGLDDYLAAGHTAADLRALASDELPDGRVTPGDFTDRLWAKVLTPLQLDQLPPPLPLIDGMMSRNTVIGVAGARGAGKSALAIDWSLSIATGTWWLGRQVHQGPVIYLAAEGSAGLPGRQRAWSKARNVLVDSVPIYWLPTSVNLLDQVQSQSFLEIIDEIQPVAVVVDTVARSMPGAAENDSAPMSRLIDAADAARSATGGAVILLHHPPKGGEGLRGHGSLEGAVDTIIEVTAAGSTVVVKCTKQKDAAKFDPIRLQLVPVGESVALYSQSSRESVGETSEQERELLRVFDESVDEGGMSSSNLLKISGIPPGSYYRVQKALVTRGLIVNVGTSPRPKWTLAPEPVA